MWLILREQTIEKYLCLSNRACPVDALQYKGTILVISDLGRE